MTDTSGATPGPRPSLRSLLLAGIVCLQPGITTALEMDVEVGLGGLIPSGGWTPVRVRCELGEDEEPVVGRVVLDRPSFAVSAYASRVSLIPGKPTIVRLCVPVGAGKSYTVRFEDADRRTIAEASPDEARQALEARDRLIVLVGGEGLGALGGGQLKSMPRLARIGARELPWDVRALEEVAAVFISGVSDADLIDLCKDARAVALLRRYVEEGGQLVFLPRPGVPPPWHGTLLEALLPVQTPKLRAATTRDLTFMLDELETAELTVLEASLRPGAAWKQHNGSFGVIAERPLGSGKTVFIAFDIDDPNVRDAKKLAKVLSGLVPHRRVFSFRLRERGVDELAGEVFATRRPLGALAFTLLVFAILLHFVVLGPLASVVSKRRGPWAALVVPPAASLVIGIVILFAGALTRGSPEVRSLEVVLHDPARPGVGRAQLEVGLYAGSDTTFALQLPGRWNPTLQERSPLDALVFRAPGPAMEFKDGSSASLGPLTVPAGGLSQLRLRGTASGPKISLRYAAGLTDAVEVVSAAPARMDGLIGVAFDSSGAIRIKRLESLPAGGTVRWQVGAGTTLQEVQLQEDMFEQDRALAADLLAQRIAALLHDEHSRSPLIPGTKHKRNFPGAWVLWMEFDVLVPFMATDGERALEDGQLRCLRVHMIPVGDE